MQRFSRSPNDPAFVQNPYPVYDAMRTLGPVVWWDDYDMPCLVSHAGVTQALRNRTLGRECPPEIAKPIPPELQPFYDVEAHSMLELEPPRHTRLRGLVLRAFTSRRIAALGPDITELSHKLIDDFPDGPFDLLTWFAQPLPVIIIARLLGVPESAAPELLRWSNAMVAMYQARRTPQIEASAIAATQEFSAFLTDYIALKRKAPSDDLISTLIAAEEDGEKLSTPELITTCILLLNAGHEATVHTLGNGTKTLLENNFSKVDTATTEEIFRFDPPLHMFTRYVYDTVEIEGHRFKRGDQVACLLGAANRDPLAYDTPNVFDPARSGPANTSFGGGIHFCVGAPLARLEVTLALQALFARCPDMKMAARPAYADVYHFHGLETLMVTR